ncbi:hypothetical protein QL285_078584 [Trifolium repens]|nr:hypothetical protein QL285_078584 [Trifolium repens]
MAVDALSRVFLMAWSEPQSHLLQEIKRETKENTQLQVLVKECLKQPRGSFPYSVKDEHLFWKGRIVLAANIPLFRKILLEYHSSPIGGHAGITRTAARISAQFFWPKLKADVKLFVQQCTVCQQAKTENFLPAGLLQPMPIPPAKLNPEVLLFIFNLGATL